MVNVLFIVAALLAIQSVCEGAGLKHKFYKKTCPPAEAIVRSVVRKFVAKDPTVAAPLLRMNFHDCFVRGCDASVLLNSTSTNKAERDAPPNLTLDGFDVIDDVKEKLEKKCPGVVSCADIIALAARDAVLTASGGPFWNVKTGRRDGTISNATEALANIPSPFFNFSQLQASFAKKGLNVEDLVVLSGGHTIGNSHCPSFSKRLYNFTGKGDMDPSLDPAYAQVLKKKCPSLADNTTSVEMVPNSSVSFDSNYYTNLLANRGLFTSDVALLTNPAAKLLVDREVKEKRFFRSFRKSMQKMLEIGVLTGSAGQIRHVCALVN
ncbi:peroxidase 39-like [Cryptomeria japonica]|uniref:peroxidase 39-like n=1 Tax=Cryptomeria japonica TaxID=3369 RepID=UPI0025AB70AF|nr:peroxidase 39-like [Cryptomeria japonica]